MCSSALKSRSLKSVISQAPTPDHKPVNVVIQMKQGKRGKGYWKLNNSLLEIEGYQEGITRIYDEIIEEYEPYVSKAVLWDYFKLRVKQFSIDFGILQARKFKDECKNLESKLDQIDKQIAENNSDVNQERKRIKEQLDEQYRKKAKGFQIRSRVKYVEQGEKSTKYFLGLEKQRQNSNCINSLKTVRALM